MTTSQSLVICGPYAENWRLTSVFVPVDVGFNMPPSQVDLWIRTDKGEILCVPEFREKWGKEHINFAVGDKYNGHVIAAMIIDKEKGARKTLAL